MFVRFRVKKRRKTPAKYGVTVIDEGKTDFLISVIWSGDDVFMTTCWLGIKYR